MENALKESIENISKISLSRHMGKLKKVLKPGTIVYRFSDPYMVKIVFGNSLIIQNVSGQVKIQGHDIDDIFLRKLTATEIEHVKVIRRS